MALWAGSDISTVQLLLGDVFYIFIRIVSEYVVMMGCGFEPAIHFMNVAVFGFQWKSGKA